MLRGGDRVAPLEERVRGRRGWRLAALGCAGGDGAAGEELQRLKGLARAHAFGETCLETGKRPRHGIVQIVRLVCPRRAGAKQALDALLLRLPDRSGAGQRHL